MVWHQPVPQQLPDLDQVRGDVTASPAGVLPSRAPRGVVKAQAGGLRGGVRRPVGRPNGLKPEIFFAAPLPPRNRGKWVLKGKPALVDSNSPRYGEKASYYSAVCLETGEVEWMELEGNSNSGTSVAFLTQLKEAGAIIQRSLRVIWDNAPAHFRQAQEWGSGAGVPRTPELELRLVNPRFHEGRLCRATARTSTPMRLSGAGRERRPLAICAWGAGRRYSANSWPGCPAGKTRRNAAAGRSCNQGPKHPRETPTLHPEIPTLALHTRHDSCRSRCSGH